MAEFVDGFGLKAVLERRPGLPLVVSQRASREQRASKLEQLGSALQPVATMARQLSLETEEAVELFRRLLESNEE